MEADTASQNDFSSCSNDGVLSSSMDLMLGRLIDRFFGVEQDGVSTWSVNQPTDSESEEEHHITGCFAADVDATYRVFLFEALSRVF